MLLKRLPNHARARGRFDPLVLVAVWLGDARAKTALDSRHLSEACRRGGLWTPKQSQVRSRRDSSKWLFNMAVNHLSLSTQVGEYGIGSWLLRRSLESGRVVPFNIQI